MLVFGVWLSGYPGFELSCCCGAPRAPPAIFGSTWSGAMYPFLSSSSTVLEGWVFLAFLKVGRVHGLLLWEVVLVGPLVLTK